jgi:hypothetical protein
MSMEAWVTALTAVIAALGGASLIPRLVDGIKAMRDNRAREEKDENRSLMGRAANAERRADREAEYRRRVEVWAGRLEYMLAQLGVPADKIPAKPEWARSKENA